MGFLSSDDLKGFSRLGKNVLISNQAIIYGRENIVIGDNVRIDAGTIILAKGGGLNIGPHTHIASQCLLSCNGLITLQGFNAISFGSKLISGSDDFGGDFLVGPLFDADYIKVTKEPIIMMQNAAIGSDSILLPGVRMAEGSVLGAKSLLNNSTQPWKIYIGSPAKEVRARNRNAKNLAANWEIEWKKRHYSSPS